MIGRTLAKWRCARQLGSAVLTFTALPALAYPQDPSPQSTGDAVADAARKAREQKKKTPPSLSALYTDEDVNHSTLGSAPTQPTQKMLVIQAAERPRFRRTGKRFVAGKTSET